MPSGLDPVLGALTPVLPDAAGTADALDRAVDVAGPRTWWAGPLDVEGLLRGALQVALGAATEVARRRGRPVRLGTTAARLAANAGSYLHLRIDGRPLVGFAASSGFFETADGWVRLHGNYPHHAAVLDRVLGVHDRAGLIEALRDRRALELEATIRRAGGIAGALRTPEQWRAGAVAAAVDAQPWVAVDRYAAGPPGPAARHLPPAADAPLGGIRVLDLTRVIAGPTASRLLALLGADVLRVDPPGLPELLDQYLDTGAGKRSAVADLGDRDVLDRLHELLTDADVLLTGYRPGALAAYGLDGAAVAERHPHLVHASLSAWGVSGPWAGDRGFDSIVQSCVGIAYRYGSPDGEGRWRPGQLPVQALDVATGYGLAAAAMALLARRAELGGGTARLSLARTAHALLDSTRPEGGAVDLEVPMAETGSSHGLLRQVRGPVLADGVELALEAPGEYGAAALAWRS